MQATVVISATTIRGASGSMTQRWCTACRASEDGQQYAGVGPSEGSLAVNKLGDNC